MDSGDGFTLLPVQGHPPAEQCVSCGAATRPEASRLARGVAEYDDDVVVFHASDRDGFVVVPRLHVKGIEELPVGSRAGVLAAVRRATNAARAENPWSAPRIVTVTDSPGSEGHLIMHVQP
jgi:diadenosine tetraphosphate (Ap4A) HIT family hydrolase